MLTFFVLIAVCLTCLFVERVNGLVEAADGSVCFNNCNGHGECIDYSCYCHVGYHGDACDTTFARDENEIIPILTAGHYNVTRKNFTQAVTKNKLILIGFSARECHKCIVVEPEYAKLSLMLKDIKVPFARADTTAMKSIAIEHAATELPSLVLFRNHKPYPYKGFHTADGIFSYVNKLRSPPVKLLMTVDDVHQFLKNRTLPEYSLSTVMVRYLCHLELN